MRAVAFGFQGFSGLAGSKRAGSLAAPSVPAGFKHAIAGDNHGGLWLSLLAHRESITVWPMWSTAKSLRRRLGRSWVVGPGPASCPTRTVASGRGC